MAHTFFVCREGNEETKPNWLRKARFYWGFSMFFRFLHRMALLNGLRPIPRKSYLGQPSTAQGWMVFLIRLIPIQSCPAVCW